MSNLPEKVNPYLDLLKPVLEDMRSAFISAVNEKGDLTKFKESIRKLDEVRQVINSAENVGIVIGIGQFTVIPFNLSGDPERDLGQVKVDLSLN